MHSLSPAPTPSPGQRNIPSGSAPPHCHSVKRNRTSRTPRRSRRQTLIPNIPSLKQNRIPRHERLPIHLRNRLPRCSRRSPVIRVVPRARAHVVSGPGREAAPHQKQEDDNFSRRPHLDRDPYGHTKTLRFENCLAATTASLLHCAPSLHKKSPPQIFSAFSA